MPDSPSLFSLQAGTVFSYKVCMVAVIFLYFTASDEFFWGGNRRGQRSYTCLTTQAEHNQGWRLLDVPFEENTMKNKIFFSPSFPGLSCFRLFVVVWDPFLPLWSEAGWWWRRVFRLGFLISLFLLQASSVLHFGILFPSAKFRHLSRIVNHVNYARLRIALMVKRLTYIIYVLCIDSVSMVEIIWDWFQWIDLHVTHAGNGQL